MKEPCGKWMQNSKTECTAPKGHKWECRADYEKYLTQRREGDRRHYAANRDRINAQRREFRATNKDKLNARDRDYRRKYHITFHGKAIRLLKAASERAKEKGLPFDLTIDWMEAELEKVMTNGCPLLSIPITLDGTGTARDNSPSVDQIAAGLGYTQQNCWIISWKANCSKKDASLELMQKVLDEANKRGLKDGSTSPSIR